MQVPWFEWSLFSLVVHLVAAVYLVFRERGP